MVKSINKLRPKFTTHADGSDAVLFMHELVGEQDGPTIGISASIHGNENTGSQAILDLYRIIKDMPLKGRILLLPVANPQSFAVNHRFTPLDRAESQPRIPGRPRGNYTQQLADALAREFFDKIDANLTCIPAPTGRPSTMSISGTTRRCRALSARRSSTARPPAKLARSIPAPPRPSPSTATAPRW